MTASATGNGLGPGRLGAWGWAQVSGGDVVDGEESDSGAQPAYWMAKEKHKLSSSFGVRSSQRRRG